MLPSGIYVKAQLELLISALPRRIEAHGPSRVRVDEASGGPPPEGGGAVCLSRWSEDWCFLEVDGPEELTVLVMESLIHHDPVQEVLSWHYRPEKWEFSYSLFRNGKSLETFQCWGPSVETVNFTSELRRVPLQSLLRASDFMTGSLEHFGLESGQGVPDTRESLRLHVTLPGKRTIWQKLLGAAYRG